MAYYVDYPYPPYYVPEPWRTTYIPHHYPEKHYPLEHFRHAVGSTVSAITEGLVHPFAPDTPIYNPTADVRETKTKYFVDVELPGLDDVKALKLKWLSARTLLVETTTKRSVIEADEEQHAEGTEKKDDGAPLTKTEKHEDAKEMNGDGKSAKKNNVALTVHERRVGLFARAFSFPTKVDHAKMEAKLHAGILSIVCTKLEPDLVKEEHKEVEVKHSGH